jgi:hypothetical protein
MRKLSNWDHCCDHSLKIDCSRYAFDILFDEMPESFAQIGMRDGRGPFEELSAASFVDLAVMQT